MTARVEVEVVVAHSERATLRVGDVFLKVDSDPANADVEVEAMAPVPTPEVLWRKPPVLALAALRGTEWRASAGRRARRRRRGPRPVPPPGCCTTRRYRRGAALLVRHRPKPFREDDLQALVRLLPIHERPSDSGPSPATALATLAADLRRPPLPSARQGTAPTRRSVRARERPDNHRIRSSAVTRTPPGARWRTAPAPPRRRSDRPARLRGSTSGWDRCARPSCAEPGTARRGTWCSRPAP